MIKKFIEHTGLAAGLARDNVDTDMIIPARYLTSTSREGYGKNLFKELREKDPDFFLNQERLGEASILISGRNFGCGSSREHAVWALMQAGFRVIIAESFADIFKSNSERNGLILVSLQREIIRELLERAAASELVLTVNLEKLSVSDRQGNLISTFEYDPFRRYCLLNELDDLDYLLSFKAELMKFRTERAEKLFLGGEDGES
ncbi:MAG: 3-isopropylmalate dehydratase small subunit [Candidatus Dadabacteria bacterium]|nr:MAG: 3-isopropylmalate dehydratase small subunit [Candidatus Dadabacteria bacterium]